MDANFADLYICCTHAKVKTKDKSFLFICLLKSPASGIESSHSRNSFSALRGNIETEPGFKM